MGCGASVDIAEAIAPPHGAGPLTDYFRAACSRGEAFGGQEYAPLADRSAPPCCLEHAATGIVVVGVPLDLRASSPEHTAVVYHYERAADFDRQLHMRGTDTEIFRALAAKVRPLGSGGVYLCTREPERLTSEEREVLAPRGQRGPAPGSPRAGGPSSPRAPPPPRLLLRKGGAAASPRAAASPTAGSKAPGTPGAGKSPEQQSRNDEKACFCVAALVPESWIRGANVGGEPAKSPGGSAGSRTPAVAGAWRFKPWADELRGRSAHERYKLSLAVARSQAMQLADRHGASSPGALFAAQEVARLLRLLREPGKALDELRPVLRRHEEALGATHRQTLSCLVDLGALLHEAGHLSEAEALLIRAAEGQELVHGASHPATLDAVERLGRVLASRGNFGAAEVHLRRVAQVREQRSKGMSCPDARRSAGDHAVLLKLLGRHQEAEQGLRRLLAAQELLLGPTHPEVLAALNNLGLAARSSGRLAEAEALLLRACDGKRATLGPRHPSTLLSLTNLAVLSDDAGDGADATPLVRGIVRDKEQRLGPNRHSTITSVNNLALLSREPGFFSTSEELRHAELLLRRCVHSEGVTVSEKSHPDTLTSLSNIAVVFGNAGRTDEAEKAHRHVEKGRIAQFGPAHPHALVAHNNFAMLLKAKGHLEEAKVLMERTLEGKDWALGPDHPSTLTACHNLGLLCGELGDKRQAERLLRRALRGKAEALGARHPSTVASLRGLAVLLLAEGALEPLRPLVEELAEVLAQAKGPAHEEALSALNDAARVLVVLGDHSGAAGFLRRELEGRLPAWARLRPALDSLAAALAGFQSGAEARRACAAGAAPFLKSAARLLTAMARCAAPGAGARRSSAEGGEEELLEELSSAALHLRRIGRRTRAEPLLRAEVEGRERLVGSSHPSYWASAHNLAVLLQEIGNLKEAERLYRRVATCKEVALGAFHPLALAAMNSLAEFLRACGRPAEAEQAYRSVVGASQVLSAQESLLDGAASETATPRPKLSLTASHETGTTILAEDLGASGEASGYGDDQASTCSPRGGPEESQAPAGRDEAYIEDEIVGFIGKPWPTQAELRLRRAVECCEAFLGPRHPNTLTCLNNLAVLLQGLGKHREAEPLLLKACDGREASLGPAHPDTLTCLNNLAMSLKAAGKLHEAEPILRRALCGCELALGPAHAGTLACLGNLAMLLHAKGKHHEAELYMSYAVAGCLSVYGPAHPDTVVAYNNLGMLMKALGKPAEAEALYRRALAAGEPALGPQHPRVLTSLNNLAVLLQEMGRLEEAEPLLRRSAAGRDAVLGPVHPDTLNSWHNLAVLLQASGRRLAAETLLRGVASACSAALGPAHPHTVTAWSSLSALLSDQRMSAGKSQEADVRAQNTLEGGPCMQEADAPPLPAPTAPPPAPKASVRRREDNSPLGSLRALREACDRATAIAEEVSATVVRQGSPGPRLPAGRTVGFAGRSDGAREGGAGPRLPVGRTVGFACRGDNAREAAAVDAAAAALRAATARSPLAPAEAPPAPQRPGGPQPAPALPAAAFPRRGALKARGRLPELERPRPTQPPAGRAAAAPGPAPPMQQPRSLPSAPAMRRLA